MLSFFKWKYVRSFKKLKSLDILLIIIIVFSSILIVCTQYKIRRKYSFILNIHYL